MVQRTFEMRDPNDHEVEEYRLKPKFSTFNGSTIETKNSDEEMNM